MSASSDCRGRDIFGVRKVKNATFVFTAVFSFVNTKNRHWLVNPLLFGALQSDGLAPTTVRTIGILFVNVMISFAGSAFITGVPLSVNVGALPGSPLEITS